MRRVFVCVLVVALGILGDAAIIGVTSAGAASHATAHHSVPAKKKKKKYVHKPTIKVKPTSNLTDGQLVIVAGTGYKKNTSLGINECADKGDQTAAGDCDLAATKVREVQRQRGRASRRSSRSRAGAVRGQQHRVHGHDVRAERLPGEHGRAERGPERGPVERAAQVRAARPVIDGRDPT